MKSSVITFPGSNCDRDMDVALKKFGFKNKMVWHNDVELPKSDLVVLPGGFSYGDYLRCGSMASKSKIMQSVINFANSGGMVMGICNGFQALVKLGLFEASTIKDHLTEDDETLTYNTSMRHQTELVGMEVRSVLSPILSPMKAWERFVVPISNGEGRLIMPDRRFDQYTEAWQIPLVYIDENGETTNKYNGSKWWAAALTSPDGRIFGLMPHPERTGLNVFKNVPGNHDMPIFEGIRDSIVGNK